jgi:hypothetical protein
VFDLAEEALDEIALLVESGVEWTARGCCYAARNDRDRTASGSGIEGTLSVIALIGEDEAGFEAIE